MLLLSVSSFVDPRLKAEDWRSFLHATQIVQILFALLYIGIISTVGLSFFPIFSYYAMSAVIYIVCTISLLVFLRRSRYFLIDSKLKLSIRTRVKIAGHIILILFFLASTYSMLESGVFSAGFCFQFALPLMTIAMTGSKFCCIFSGLFGTISQQSAVVLEGLGHEWRQSPLQGTSSLHLLLFHAFLCIILNIFITEMSVSLSHSFNQTHKVMQNANKKAKQLLDDQVNFIANATHELRTPVMEILGLVDLLSSLNKDAEVEPLIETLRSATMGTVELVNDVLDYEKVGKGMVKLERSPFDIRQLIKRLLNMNAIQAHAKQIELMAVTSGSVPEVVIGDQMRVYQILQNLMSNAIKFTVPKDKTNEILVKVDSPAISASPSKLQLAISIKDTGIGISRDSIPQLFQAFHQASSATTRIFGGTGLGLAISRNLARAMNGDISVHSNGPGKGTWFNVSIEVDTQSSYYEFNRKLPTGSGIVAIFDDVQTSLSLLEDAVLMMGYEVRAFFSFSGLVHFLSAKNPIPRLLMIDIGSIGSTSVSGPILLETVRNLDIVYGNVPIIALNDQANLITGLGPYTACYPKPILSEQVQSIVTSMLSGNKYEYQSDIKTASSTTIDIQMMRRFHVLLVDDNTVNLKVIGRMLEKLGHEVTMCDTGQSALQIVNRSMKATGFAGQEKVIAVQHPINIAITDYMIPEMNGLQLVREIRRMEQETPRVRTLPIILTSGTSMSRIQAELELCRKTCFLMKPFTLQALQSALNQFSNDDDR